MSKKIKLRPYQKQDFKEVIQDLKKNNHVIFGGSTGYGKSVCILKLVSREIRKKHGRVLVIAPRRKLVKQLKETLGDHYPSIIMGTDTIYRKESDLFIASMATLQRRLKTYGRKYLNDISMIVIDEVHIGTSGKSFEILKKLYWEESKWVGFSATPIDSQGYRMEGWDNTIYNYQAQDLIELGFLTPIKIMVTEKPEGLDNVGIVGGDYNEGQLGEFMSEEARVNNVYEMWKKYAQKRLSIIFAVNIAHAEVILEDFKKHNIKVGIVHSGLHESDEEYTMQEFADRKLDVVINVGKLTTGVDIPPIDCLIIARPTKSKSLIKQIVGRGLRLYKGKKNTLILDLAGVVAQHGYLTKKFDFNRVRQTRDDNEPMLFNDMVCPYCEYEFQPRNARREVITKKLFITTRTYCPNCHEITKEVVVDTKKIKRLELVKDYTNTTKVSDKQVGKFIEKLQMSAGYKAGWTAHIATRYNRDEEYQDEIKMIYNKFKAKMIKPQTAINNIRKLQD